MTSRDADDSGSVIPVARVSRWTGIPRQTLARWVESGAIPGRVIKGKKRKRYFMSRAAALSLRDARDETLATLGYVPRNASRTAQT